MKFSVCLIALLVSLFPLSGDMNLIEKAREIEEANWRLVPGETHHSIKVILDRSGEVIFEAKVKLAHKLDDEGNVINELIEKEICEENSRIGEQRLEEILDKDMTPKKEGFFLTDEEDNPLIEPLTETSEIEGKICEGFEFVYTTRREGREMTFEGVLWLDTETGSPVYSSSEAVSTPLFVGDMQVEQFFHYDADTGIGYLTELRTVTGINIPLRSMTLKMSEKYFDYWEYEGDKCE